VPRTSSGVRKSRSGLGLHATGCGTRAALAALAFAPGWGTVCLAVPALFWLLSGLVLAAPSPDEIERAVRTVFEDSEYQTELPLEAEPERVETESTGRSSRSGDVDLEAVSAVGQVVSALWWILAGVAVLFVIGWIVREIPGRRWERAEAAAAPAPPPEDVATEVPDPEALAREGRYAEAVHALLLVILARIRDRLAPSWTSREVLRQVEWRDEVRTELAKLVGAVERSQFGGARVERRHYESCTEHARAVLAALPERRK